MKKDLFKMFKKAPTPPKSPEEPSVVDLLKVERGKALKFYGKFLSLRDFLRCLSGDRQEKIALLLKVLEDVNIVE